MIKRLLLVLICASASSATFTFLSPDTTGIVAEVRANFAIAWEGAYGLVTISLVDGSSTHSQGFGIIDSELSTPQYIWNPDAYLVGGPYSISAVDDSSNIYYSVSFSLTNNTAGSSRSASMQFSSVISPSTSSTSRLSLASTTTPPSSSSLESLGPTPSAISIDTDLPTQSGLNVGSKVGIAFGASLGGITLIVIAAIFIFKQGKRSEASKRDSMETSAFIKSELSAGNAPIAPTSEALSGGKEIKVHRARLSELDGRELHSPAELYGDAN